MFTLAISCLTSSNCLDSWTWHSRFLCNISLYSIRPCFYHQLQPQLAVVFALAPSLPSGVISPLISSSMLSTYWPGEFLFQYPIILPFHTVHGVLKARILKWFAIPFSSGPHCVRPLHHDCPSWVAPEAWLSFIQLDKAVVLVWLNWLVFCDYRFSVSALWCPLATHTILLGFLLP